MHSVRMLLLSAMGAAICVAAQPIGALAASPAGGGLLAGDKTAGTAIAPPPAVRTVAASATGPTTAVVEGFVEPKPWTATMYVDYALASEPWCTSHGAEGSPAEERKLGSVGPAGDEAFGFAAQLQGLTPGRQYCAEMVARYGESGIVFGGQLSFTTPLIETAEYTNWVLSGSLTDKRLGQALTLPEGSTFNGRGEVNPQTGAGSVTGHLSVPRFTAKLKLFGVLPVSLGITLTQVGSVEGVIAKSEAVAGDELLGIPSRLSLGITSVGALGLTIPTSCTTSEPLGLELADNLTREELLTKGWSFVGTATLPSFKCEGGLLGRLFGQVLTTVLSGPENPYSISIEAPGT